MGVNLGKGQEREKSLFDERRGFGKKETRPKKKKESYPEEKKGYRKGIGNSKRIN